MNTLTKLSLFTALLGTLAMPAQADTPINQSHALANDARVKISNVAGDVEVSTWSDSKVSVTGMLGEGAERVALEGDEHNLKIRVVLPDNSHHTAGTHLVVKLPATVDLSVGTVSADIKADGLKGPRLALESVSGNIHVQSAVPDLSLSTVSGNIEGHNQGDVQHTSIQSVSGDVNVTGIGGDTQLKSVSGDISADGSDFTRVTLENTSGDVHWKGALSGSGRLSARSISGDVALTFTAQPNARFDISSFSGDIDSDIGPAPEKSSEYTPGKTLNFSAGDGKGDVSVNTMSGEVTIRTK